MLTLLLFILGLHPLHVSTTEIAYSDKDRALQIVARVFVDDLELSIRRERQQPDLDLLHPQYGLTTRQLAADYVAKRLDIKLDGKPAVTRFLGYEEENFALVMYLEIERVEAFASMEILNTLILETYEDQSNIVHVDYRGEVKSARLMRKNPHVVFTF